MGIYEKLASIGINISSSEFDITSSLYVDIESTLIEAADVIAKGHDSRVLSLILSWIRVHGELVNIERLKKKMLSEVENFDCTWVCLFAFYGVSIGQSRWKLLAKRKVDKLTSGPADMVLARAKFKGEESWSIGSGFVIPKDSEPIESKFILAPDQIAQINRFYRNRLIYGASWRADLATAIDAGAKTPTEISKWAGSSYEPAYRIFHDFQNAGVLNKYRHRRPVKK